MIKLRSFIFLIVISLLMVLLWPVALVGSLSSNKMTKYRLATVWGRIYIPLLYIFVGIKFRVTGQENIPDTPCVVFAKHQSALDIFILLKIFNPQSWILKEELLKIPFFGWTLALSDPIAINRKDGVRALKKVTDKGAQKIKAGNWVIIYPEGTRNPPGAKVKHKRGGVAMAKEADVDILPVALNTGLFWGRNKLAYKSGTVDIVIGKPIKTKNLDNKTISLQAENWIENKSYDLIKNHPYYIKLEMKEDTNV